jgi:hypothetical protein
MTKALKKIGLEASYFNIMKATCNKPIGKIILNGENLRSFCLKSGRRQRYQRSSFLFNIVLKILARS